MKSNIYDINNSLKDWSLKAGVVLSIVFNICYGILVVIVRFYLTLKPPSHPFLFISVNGLKTKLTNKSRDNSQRIPRLGFIIQNKASNTNLRH